MVRLTAGHETATDARLLCLIRHGKAAPKDVGLSDFERSLTGKGVAECTKVARSLAEKKLTIDLMISSPADRALETAHIFAEILRYPALKILIAERLYSGSSALAVSRLLPELAGNSRCIALFGHNPLFNELASLLIGGFDRDITKGTAVGISFEHSSWADLHNPSGRLEFYLSPSSLAARNRASI